MLKSKFRKEVEFVLNGGMVKRQGKDIPIPGVINNVSSLLMMITALNDAIIAVARMKGISAKDLEREAANKTKNQQYLQLLQEAEELRRKASEINNNSQNNEAIDKKSAGS